MRDDGPHSRVNQTGKDVAGVFGNKEIGKLDQQISAMVNRVLLRGGQGVRDIVRREVKVAAEIDPG